MSVNYNSKKKPELEALLKERGLAHSGNKPDLVQRLQEDDAKKEAAPQGDAAPAPQADDIDWDEGDAPATKPAPVAAEPTKESAPPAAVAETADVPPVVDEAKVADNTEEPKPEPTEAGASEAKPSAKESAEAAEAKKKAWDEKVGGKVAVTSAEEEAAKRKARLAKFGAVTAEPEPTPVAEETLTDEQKAEKEKKEARAKKFGTAPVAAPETSIDANERIAKALDRALPERPERSERKRGRDRGDIGRGGVNKRVDSRRRDNREKPRGPRNGPQRSGMSEADRKAKEARAKRFGAAPA